MTENYFKPPLGQISPQNASILCETTIDPTVREMIEAARGHSDLAALRREYPENPRA